MTSRTSRPAWPSATGWASAGPTCRLCCGSSTASSGIASRESFGFRHVWSTSAIAAPWFVGAVLGLEVLFTFYVGSHPFLLARLRVSAGGGLDGQAMRELPASVRVVAIRRAADAMALEYPPRRDTRLAPDDDAYLVGPYAELLQVLRHDRETASSD